ncbi:MAG TPA: hypothetical protein VGL53_29810 [Bryobacteraceae bacterium]
MFNCDQMDDSNPIIDVTHHPSGFVPNDDFWAFLRRRKGSIALLWIIGIAVALWWILSMPAVYQAESRVMVVRLGQGGPVSEAELASEIELVRDPTHLERAASKQNTTLADGQLEALKRKIESALSVAPSGKSNLIAIDYRDPDANAAAHMANEIVDFYLADRRFIFQLNGAPPTKASAGGSTAASELLSAFDTVNHGPQLRAELQARVQHRIDLESRLADQRAQIRDYEASAKQLRQRLTALPDRIQSRTRVSMGRSPSSRTVEETEILNPLKQQIQSDLIKNDGAVAGLQARIDETTIDLRTARIAEEQTSSLAAERERLEQRAADARGASESVTAVLERPTLRATLVNRAEPPNAPMPERLWLWIPLGILAALTVALIIAWLIDQFDKPIYTSDDFEDASGVPPVDHFSQGAGA